MCKATGPARHWSEPQLWGSSVSEALSLPSTVLSVALLLDFMVTLALRARACLNGRQQQHLDSMLRHSLGCSKRRAQVASKWSRTSCAAHCSSALALTSVSSAARSSPHHMALKCMCAAHTVAQGPSPVTCVARPLAMQSALSSTRPCTHRNAALIVRFVARVLRDLLLCPPTCSSTRTPGPTRASTVGSGSTRNLI